MREDWWKAVDDALRDKFPVDIEVIGGQGDLIASCETTRCSVLATNDLTNSSGDPETNIDSPSTYPTSIWRAFFADQTPDAEGKIEIRLHYFKKAYTIYDKTWISAASFDDLSLTPSRRR